MRSLHLGKRGLWKESSLQVIQLGSSRTTMGLKSACVSRLPQALGPAQHMPCKVSPEPCGSKGCRFPSPPPRPPTSLTDTPDRSSPGSAHHSETFLTLSHGKGSPGGPLPFPHPLLGSAHFFRGLCPHGLLPTPE